MARGLGISEDEARLLANQLGHSIQDADRLEANFKQVARDLGLSEQQARAFARQMSNAGRAAEETDQATNNIRQGIGRAVAAAAAFVGIRETFSFVGRQVVQPFIAFDAAINESLAIVSDVTPQIRTQFEETARVVAQSTTFAAHEAGEAFFFLASAGLSAEQQLAALPTVAQFAQAGMFDLALATDLLTDAQSALGLTVDDASENLANMQRISDVLTQANILSNATIQQFSEAITNRAGAALRILNKDIEEGAAVLAAFADQGLKGEAAGEALNIVLRDLQRAALTEAEAFDKMNVAVFDSEGNMRNIADIVGDLESLLDGMSDATVRATLMTLGFQDRSVSNLLTLLGTSDAIREYETNLRSAGGATEEVAEKQLQSLSGQLKLAESAARDSALEFGEALLPVIQEITRQLPEMAANFEALVPSVATGTQQVAGFIEHLGTAVHLGTEFSRGLGAVGDVATGLGGAFVNVGQSISDILAADFGSAITQWRQGGAALEGIVSNLQVRTQEDNLIAQLREGVDPALALANSLAALSRAGELNEASLGRFAAISGLTTQEVIELNFWLRTQQQEHQFTAAELALLEAQYLQFSGVVLGVRQGLNFGRGGRGAQLDDLTPTAEQLTAVDLFRQEAEELGISLAELVELREGEGVDLFAGLAPTDADALAYEVFVERIANARDRLDEATTDMSESLTVLTTVTNDAGEEIAATADQILEDLITQFETQAEFEANLARLAAAGAETLALELAEQGPAAAGAAEALVNDLDRALEAEEILQGQATENVDAFATTLGDDLSELDFTAEGEDVMLGLALSLNTPAIRNAIARNVAAAVNVIPTTVETELRIESPSKVMAELGEQTALGFLVGFEALANQPIEFSPTFDIDIPDIQTLNVDDLLDFDPSPTIDIDPQLNIADPDAAALIDTAATVPVAVAAQAAPVDRATVAALTAALTAGGGAAGATSLQLINVNPRVEPGETTTAKQLQLAAATVPLLSRTRPNLPRR